MVGSDSAAVQEYLKENRKEVMKMIRHEDSFIRAIGFAVLLEGGDDADLELVKRELNLLEELEGDFDFY